MRRKQTARIKAVAWDNGQVLWGVREPGWLSHWRKYLERADKALGDLQAVDLAKVKDDLMLAQVGFEIGVMSVEGHRLFVSKALRLDSPLTWEEYEAVYVRTPRVELNEPLYDVIGAIHKNGSALQAMVSNVCPIWAKLMTHPNLVGCFKASILSCEVGWHKPSEAMVEEALRRLGTRAEETLFVDDVADNLAPAAAMGAETHLFTDNGHLYVHLLENGFPHHIIAPLMTEKWVPLVNRPFQHP